METNYDVVIIGAGPAGLTAGIYAARDRFSTLMIERGAIGGNIINAELVENYPAFPEGISGFELTAKMHEQATGAGTETMTAEVKSVQIQKGKMLISTTEGDVTSRMIIVASGTERQKLNVEGEKELTGRGVSYCATCDGPFFKGKEVAVVGGGNAALYEALHLSKFASRVNLIHRRNAFRATRAVQEKVLARANITVLWDTVVENIEGTTKVEAISIRNVKNDNVSRLDMDGVFVAVGLKPNTGFISGMVELDPSASIRVDKHLKTSTGGIFAAGDVRSDSVRQVVTACGDGATAAFHAREYLEM